jgi:hypothetical protein
VKTGKGAWRCTILVCVDSGASVHIFPSWMVTKQIILLFEGVDEEYIVNWGDASSSRATCRGIVYLYINGKYIELYAWGVPDASCGLISTSELVKDGAAVHFSGAGSYIDLMAINGERIAIDPDSMIEVEVEETKYSRDSHAAAAPVPGAANAFAAFTVASNAVAAAAAPDAAAANAVAASNAAKPFVKAAAVAAARVTAAHAAVTAATIAQSRRGRQAMQTGSGARLPRARQGN